MQSSKSCLIIGVMSGTSLDGIDIAACKFVEENGFYTFEIIKAETIPYQQHEIDALKNAFHLSGVELISLHHQYGNSIGEMVKQFCDTNHLKPDYIASHGHTIFHQPEKGFTFQLGHGANIAARAGIKTICDFRTSDVAYGGQGAPLVPIGDELLFSEYDYCLNLGGISNISFHENGIRKAFDVGICNMALNELAQQANLSFDKDGLLAQSGTINQALLNMLIESAENYHANHHSLGYEWYNKHIKTIIDKATCSIANKLNTFCEFIAIQITAVLQNEATVLVTGGGAKNKFLIHLLQSKCNCKIIIPEEEVIDFKEALLFAFLGILRAIELPNSLKLVTGASKDAIGGCIYLP